MVRCRAVAAPTSAAGTPAASVSLAGGADERARAHVAAREAWLTAAVLFALALIVRAVAAISVAFPVPEDTAYYVGVARNVLEGHGLVTDALWSFATPPLLVPRAAFEIWLPLPTFLSLLPMALAGTEHWFRAAQVWSVLVSAAIPVLAWRLAADVATEKGLPESRVHVLAIGAGLVCVVLGPLATYGALPDSTAPFTVLALAGCLLMTRISADPRGARDVRLAVLGVVLGLSLLTRSEAAWLALAWVAVAWLWTAGSRRDRAILIAVPAAIAALFYVPWAIRDWAEFGTPLPGQTASNALFTNYRDVFAYSDPPTLARYLAQGPATIVEQHVGGFGHDLINVLIIQGFPIGLLGFLALPLVWRLRAARPLLLAATLTFLITSAVFPVATRAGTFLHAAGPIYVLLAVACLFGLDAFIAWVGRIRHWYRPVAWLGPAFAVAVAIPICGLSIYGVARSASDTETHYRDLTAALASAGVDLRSEGPIIANYPVWLAESARVPTIALPDESAASVLDLARHFGSKLVVVELPDEGRHWPEALQDGSAAAKCYSEVDLADTSGSGPAAGASLARFHVFRIVCP